MLDGPNKASNPESSVVSQEGDNYYIIVIFKLFLTYQNLVIVLLS